MYKNILFYHLLSKVQQWISDYSFPAQFLNFKSVVFLGQSAYQSYFV